MALGKRVKEARDKLGISQAQLAERVGLSQQGINKLEQRDSPSSKAIVELAMALGVSPEWLKDAGLPRLPCLIHHSPPVGRAISVRRRKRPGSRFAAGFPVPCGVFMPWRLTPLARVRHPPRIKPVAALQSRFTPVRSVRL